MTTCRSREGARGLALEGMGALLVIALMLVHLQDYFAGRTAVFTAGFAALWMAALAAASLARHREPDPGPRPIAGWIVRGTAAAACLCIGAAHLFPAWHTPARLLWIGAAGTVLACAATFAGGRPARAAAPLAGAAFLIMLTTPVAYQGTPFFWPRDTLFQATALATFGFFAAAALAALQPRVVLAGAIVSGTVLRIHGISHHEIDAVHRDMLPLVQYACDAFLAGRNPYGTIYWANHDLPLTYLPAMWLTYLPALAARIDIRWTSIAATMVIAAIVLRWGSRPVAGGGRPGLLERLAPADPSPAMAALAVAVVMQPEVFWNAIHGEPIVYWLWAALFLDAVRASRPWRAAIFLGLLVSSRHFGILYVPFAAAWFLAGRDGWRIGAARLLAAGSIACALVIPFFAANPDAFLYGTVDWLVTYGQSRRTWWDAQIGFQQWFYHAGREASLRWVQIAGIGLGSIAAALLSARAAIAGLAGGRRDLAAWLPLAPAYAIFVLFNGMIWKSFLFTVLLAVAFVGSLAARGPGRREPGLASWEARIVPTRVLPWVLAPMVALVGYSAGALYHGWHAHRNLADVAYAAQVVAARDVWSGDLLVDWSAIQAGHVPARSLFEGLPLPDGVRRVTRMRSEDLSTAGRIVLFDGFSMFDPDADFPDLVRVTSRKMGRSQLHVFRTGHAMGKDAWRLSAHPDAVTGAVFMGDEPPSFPGTKDGVRWTFAGMPPWNWVGPTTIRPGGRPVRLVWAHPSEGRTLRIEVDLPSGGQAILVTALDDVAVRPLFAPVEVIVAGGADGKTARRIVHPDLAGRWFWHLGEVKAGELILEIRTERGALRHFAMDVILAGQGGGEKP